MSSGAPSPLTADRIRRALGEFGVPVTDQQVSQIQQYMTLLLTWNDKINLTAIRDPSEILYRHFCECMYAAVAVPVEKGRLADIGSGGGFPGLPLAILRPELVVSLVECNVKKATFLAEVVRNIELKSTRVIVSRYEELGEELTPLDVVTSRAVGEFAPFLAWASSKHVNAGSVVLWTGGRDVDAVRTIPGWTWKEPVQIPKSLQRFLLVGTPGA